MTWQSSGRDTRHRDLEWRCARNDKAKVKCYSYLERTKTTRSAWINRYAALCRKFSQLRRDLLADEPQTALH